MYREHFKQYLFENNAHLRKCETFSLSIISSHNKHILYVYLFIQHNNVCIMSIAHQPTFPGL